MLYRGLAGELPWHAASPGGALTAHVAGTAELLRRPTGGAAGLLIGGPRPAQAHDNNDNSDNSDNSGPGNGNGNDNVNSGSGPGGGNGGSHGGGGRRG